MLQAVACSGVSEAQLQDFHLSRYAVNGRPCLRHRFHVCGTRAVTRLSWDQYQELHLSCSCGDTAKVWGVEPPLCWPIDINRFLLLVFPMVEVVSSAVTRRHVQQPAYAVTLDGILPDSTPSDFGFCGTVRRYYIAAEETEWDYAPTG
jgi:hypothetical protein